MWLFLAVIAVFFTVSVSSCGKGAPTSPQGINIQYHVVNLSPDLYPVDLFINNQMANTSPFVFAQDQGYFYLPAYVLPFQIRSALNTGTTFFTRNDPLQAGAKYTLYIIGDVALNDTTTLFTVDTSTSSPLGTGKLRFVNVSPTATGGLDVYANGSPAFKSVVYKQVSGIITLPVGNYDMQIDASGTTTVLNEMPAVTIQDGRLYTLYAYGYTSRADTAAFNATITTNR